MPEIKPAVLEAVMGMIVHDLRNPTATIGANLSFVREVLGDASVSREEIDEALADAQQGLHDLMRGLDQVAWFGRWCNDRKPLSTQAEPLSTTFDRVRARVRYGSLVVTSPPPELVVRGGEALERLLELLIANGQQHAPRGSVALSATQLDGQVRIEVVDEGRPLAPALSAIAFTLEGQSAVKGKSEGRYGRVLGLFSAATLAEGLGAKLSAEERAGKNVFMVELPLIATT